MSRPRIQFQIADLICVVMIIGAVPLIFASATGSNNIPAMQIVLLILTAFLEVVAAPWACLVLRAWSIKNFLNRFAVHVYAFVGVLGILVLFGQVIMIAVTLIFGTLASALDQHRSDSNFPIAEFMLMLMATVGSTLSMGIVESKRVKRVEAETQ